MTQLEGVSGRGKGGALGGAMGARAPVCLVTARRLGACDGIKVRGLSRLRSVDSPRGERGPEGSGGFRRRSRRGGVLVQATNRNEVPVSLVWMARLAARSTLRLTPPPRIEGDDGGLSVVSAAPLVMYPRTVLRRPFLTGCCCIGVARVE